MKFYKMNNAMQLCFYYDSCIINCKRTRICSLNITIIFDNTSVNYECTLRIMICTVGGIFLYKTLLHYAW
jgi:hypothetical protein